MIMDYLDITARRALWHVCVPDKSLANVGEDIEWFARRKFHMCLQCQTVGATATACIFAQPAARQGSWLAGLRPLNELVDGLNAFHLTPSRPGLAYEHLNTARRMWEPVDSCSFG